MSNIWKTHTSRENQYHNIAELYLLCILASSTTMRQAEKEQLFLAGTICKHCSKKKSSKMKDKVISFLNI